MNIGIFYGGVSCEHEISVITAMQIFENIDYNKYKVYPLYQKGNKIYTGNYLRNIKHYENFQPQKADECIIKDQTLYKLHKNKLTKLCTLNAVIMAAHGGSGENGSAQGFFEMQQIPYTSAGILGCAVTMDKAFQKKVCKALSIPSIDYVALDLSDYKKAPNEFMEKMEKSLQYPIIVKPSHLGSSIGINIAKNRNDLEHALEVAFSFDSLVVAEKAIVDLTEYNCAAFEYHKNIYVSCIEKPVRWHEILSFEDKYQHGGGKYESVRECPANIDADLAGQIRKLTADIYREMNLGGIVRIDYIFDAANAKLYVNEVNSIPGSLAYYLFQPQGLSFGVILDMLIEEAITQYKEKENFIDTFRSGVLKISPKGKA